MNKRAKKGFTLLEVVLATTIFAIVSASVIGVVMQAVKSQRLSEQIAMEKNMVLSSYERHFTAVWALNDSEIPFVVENIIVESVKEATRTIMYDGENYKVVSGKEFIIRYHNDGVRGRNEYIFFATDDEIAGAIG